MNCPSCGHPVEARAKYCSECGQRLGSPVRAEPAPRAYTPAHLVEKILSTRSAVQGERKLVTVLFADVHSSMDLASQVDPELWHQILDQFFAILAEGIHQVEGTINQYTGDGVMALFGAPLSHEDHAQRACHAALALRAELRRYADTLRLEHGLSFAVRMGLNSGEVVVGRIGDDLRMDYTAQGHTVGLAARMEQLAAPGTILLAAATAELVSGYFELRDLGPARVKGMSEPMHVFELEGPGTLRNRLERSRARGFATFVGRADELTRLEHALEQAFAGNGRVVGVEGDPGLGKSRLCAEFVAALRSRGLNVYQAHCPSHGRSIPFLPILALLRAWFGISEREPARTAREKIAGRMLLRDDSLRQRLPVLYEFLGIADPSEPSPRLDPEARQRQLFHFLRSLVEARPTEDPALLYVDDLHWIDTASDGFMAELASAVAATRTLLLVNYRPEYRAAWMELPHFEHVALRPLSANAADALLDELLGNEPQLSELRQRILERTGGNPFFLEEVIQSLRSQGILQMRSGAMTLTRPITEIRIPDTVQAVLAARIDQLDESDKEILQTAAVIGKTFDVEVLIGVSNLVASSDAIPSVTALERLAIAGLVIDQSSDRDRRFAFKHPLTQEVAYRSQLAVRRERVHRAVAQVMQQCHHDRLDEVAALIAHHAEQAGDAIEAARWHRRAAEWAGVSDMAEAVRHCQRVHELTAPLTDQREAAELRLWAVLRLLDFGWRSGMAPAAAEELFEEGRGLAKDIGHLTATAALYNTYGTVIGMSGDVDRGLELVSEGAALAAQTSDRALKLATTVPLVQAQAMAGALQAAHRTLEDSLAEEPNNLGLGGRGFSPFLYLQMMRGHVRTELGHWPEAQADLDRVLIRASERGENELIGWTHEFAAYLALAKGEGDAAVQHAESALSLADRIDNPLSRASASYVLAAARLARGEWDAAIAASERGLALIRSRNTGKHWESRGLALLAEALAGAGQRERARAAAAEAEQASQRGGNRAFECFSWLAIVRARRRVDGLQASAAIEALLSRIEQLVESTGAQLYAPAVHQERAALAALAGDAETERRESDRAERLTAAMRSRSA